MRPVSSNEPSARVDMQRLCHSTAGPPTFRRETPFPARLCSAPVRMREVGDSPRSLRVTSATTDGAKSEAFGDGTMSAVAALPATFTIVPRCAKYAQNRRASRM